MYEIYLYAVGSVIVVSLISLVGIFALSIRESILRKGTFLLVSLAAGALLGDAFIHLIPESFGGDVDALFAALLVIAGILVFFVLEKFLHWHHSHGEEVGREEAHQTPNRQGKVRPLGYMILVSGGMHNLIDGIIIGASFLVSIELGIASALAIILHEIPQEIGDFGVLLHSGFSKLRALFVNFLSALTAVVGVLGTLAVGAAAEEFVIWIVPFAAGSFIYIAIADLIPELHKVKKLHLSAVQFLVLLIGIGAMYGLTFFEGNGGEHLQEPHAIAAEVPHRIIKPHI